VADDAAEAAIEAAAPAPAKKRHNTRRAAPPADDPRDAPNQTAELMIAQAQRDQAKTDEEVRASRSEGVRIAGSLFGQRAAAAVAVAAAEARVYGNAVVPTAVNDDVPVRVDTAAAAGEVTLVEAESKGTVPRKVAAPVPAKKRYNTRRAAAPKKSAPVTAAVDDRDEQCETGQLMIAQAQRDQAKTDEERAAAAVAIKAAEARVYGKPAVPTAVKGDGPSTRLRTRSAEQKAPEQLRGTNTVKDDRRCQGCAHVFSTQQALRKHKQRERATAACRA